MLRQPRPAPLLAAATLCLVALLFAPSSHAGGADPKATKPPPCACPLNYLPVCGSDGVTYGNDCPITKCGDGSITVVSQGPCPEKTPKQQVEPTTVATGPLANSSSSQPAKQDPQTQPGKPTPANPCKCTKIYLPVCGKRIAKSGEQLNRTFSNECMMQCAPGSWSLHYPGPCKSTSTNTPQQPLPPCTCPKDYLPVCAQAEINGKLRNRTFSNACRAANCSSGSWRIVSTGPCSDPRPQQQVTCACPRIFSPVCATKATPAAATGKANRPNRTFSNECVAKCTRGNWTVISQGPCPGDEAKLLGRQDVMDRLRDVLDDSHQQGSRGSRRGQRQHTSTPCACDRSYLPVCARSPQGTTRTFPNRCQAEKCTNGAFQVISTGPCPPTTAPVPSTNGAGSKPDERGAACPCELIWAPVCGSDGRTWSSVNCLKRCGRHVTMLHQGPCEDRPGSLPTYSVEPGKWWGRWHRPLVTPQPTPLPAAVPRKLLQAVPLPAPTGPSSGSEDLGGTDSMVEEEEQVLDDAMMVPPVSTSPDLDDHGIQTLPSSPSEERPWYAAAVSGPRPWPGVAQWVQQWMANHYTAPQLDAVRPYAHADEDDLLTIPVVNGQPSEGNLPSGPTTPVQDPVGGLDGDDAVGPSELAEEKPAANPAVPEPSPAVLEPSPVVPPQGCACTAIWAPVCGSDGRTYGSACMLSQCGTSKVTMVHDGPCKGDVEQPAANP